MSDIAHLIRVFYTDSDDKEQWRRDLADRVAAQIALLQAEHKDYKRRAEAAEARAEQAEHETKNLHERTRNAEARAAELEAQLTGAAATIVTLTKERDEARKTCERMNEMIKKIAKERGDAREERDEAQRTIEAQAQQLEELGKAYDRMRDTVMDLTL